GSERLAVDEPRELVLREVELLGVGRAPLENDRLAMREHLARSRPRDEGSRGTEAEMEGRVRDVGLRTNTVACDDTDERRPCASRNRAWIGERVARPDDVLRDDVPAFSAVGAVLDVVSELVAVRIARGPLDREILRELLAAIGGNDLDDGPVAADLDLRERVAVIPDQDPL